MSPNPNASTPASSAPGGEDSPVRDAAAQQAGQVKDQAQQAAGEMAGTVKQEAHQVADEAKTQAQSLAASAKQEASSQLSTQKDRLAVQSRGISEDLERISRGERPESELVNQAVTMLSDRARRVTEQLESKEPMDLLDDVRRFAARRPGTFLAIAAGVGLLAGRLTRGLKDADQPAGQDREYRTGPVAAPPTPVAPIERVPGTVYYDEQNTSGVSEADTAVGVPGGRA
jgi:uncharacterized protein YjbJ (UPF0337 family)